MVAGALLVTALVAGWYVTGGVKSDDPMQDRHLLKRGMERPPIWIYVDNSEVNSRMWADFGARSSRALNLPFLNLCYESCMKHNGSQYRVEVIGGLADLAMRLGGWGELPTKLQNPEAQVREPELNWIRAAVLAKWGGLWASPALVWMRGVGELPADRCVFFGSDDEVTFVGRGGTGGPGLRLAWSPTPEHPIWTLWEDKARQRLETKAGGSEFGRDEMYDATDAIRQGEAMNEPVAVRPTAELTRKGAAGRRLQLEDLLATAQEGGVAHFAVPSDTVVVPIPWPEIKERRNFGWFLRMSEDQILESELVVANFLRQSLSK
jgi:hypothetical protein